MCVTHLQLVNAINIAFTIHQNQPEEVISFLLLAEEGDARNLRALIPTLKQISWIHEVEYFENSKYKNRILKYLKSIPYVRNIVLRKFVGIRSWNFTDIYWHHNQQLQDYINRIFKNAKYHMIDEGVGSYLQTDFNHYEDLYLYEPDLLLHSTRKKIHKIPRVTSQLLKLLVFIYQDYLQDEKIHKSNSKRYIFLDQVYGRHWVKEYWERRFLALETAYKKAKKEDLSFVVMPHPASQIDIADIVDYPVVVRNEESKVPFEIRLALGRTLLPKKIGSISSSAAFYWLFMLDLKRQDCRIDVYYSALTALEHRDPHPFMMDFLRKLQDRYQKRIHIIRIEK